MSEEKTTLEKVQGWIFKDDPETLKRINQRRKEAEEREQMAKRKFDDPEFFDDYWASCKKDIRAEIQKMIDESDGREIGPDEKATLQAHADHRIDTAVVNMPVRWRAAFIREVNLGKSRYADDPEFRHMTKIACVDVLRVAAALGLEELEKRRNDRQKQQKRKEPPGVPFSVLVGPVDGNDLSSGEK